MDRLIVELKMTPHEAYLHINKILEQANAIMATFFTGDLMEEEATKLAAEKKQKSQEEEEFDANKIYDWSMEERDDSDIYFDPAKGNVIFASAVDGWAFRYIYKKKRRIKNVGELKRFMCIEFNNLLRFIQKSLDSRNKCYKSVCGENITLIQRLNASCYQST